MIQFLGRFHPLIVHFPIGLLIIASFFEVLTFVDRWKSLRSGIVLLVYIGTLSAIVSSVFGYFLSISENYSGELVDLHFKLGIATSIFSIIASILLLNASKTGYKNLWGFRLILFATVVCPEVPSGTKLIKSG
ncbi:DUF2231 domain-containing protein [Portibacter marinus]|uniref:DUF2231 domain-containing protein n=1 Tax=Portibacter marinus TaxID=2898660 RepID=UPI001F274097|nr:DUF2231 domain-containing protein [Portibacter marinus]